MNRNECEMYTQKQEKEPGETSELRSSIQRIWYYGYI